MEPNSVSKIYTLNKTTYINLRWIAILGQFFTVNIVKYVFDFEFDILIVNFVILLGVISNIILIYFYEKNILSNRASFSFLLIDIFQLSLILYFSGGIINPFSIFLIIPSVFSSSNLSFKTSLSLILITIFSIILLTLYHKHLIYPSGNKLIINNFYYYGTSISLIIALIFLNYFATLFGRESNLRKEALNKIEEFIAKEHELVSLGGQAAASAHSLGTPLSTISLIAKELKEELGDDKKYKEDIKLLISQSNRCNEILKKLSLNPKVDNKFFGKLSLTEYIQEIVLSFKEISNKKFNINNLNNNNKIIINRSIEIIFGLRNFIGNANKFSKNNINIFIISNQEKTHILIEDDGKGFAPDILSKLGEPYIRSSYKEHNINSGMGLGIFIAKTLLEKNYANVEFINLKNNEGAAVNISWDNYNLKNI